MKVFFLFLFLPATSRVYAQDAVFGRYKSYFGKEITLRSDSTFFYSYRFDLVGSWATGHYTAVKDTVYLWESLVYDTVQVVGTLNLTADSLVVSVDEKAERMTRSEYASRPFMALTQDRFPVPMRLVLRKGRLYALDDRGKIVSKRLKSTSNGKKYGLWYVKAVGVY